MFYTCFLVNKFQIKEKNICAIVLARHNLKLPNSFMKIKRYFKISIISIRITAFSPIAGSSRTSFKFSTKYLQAKILKMYDLKFWQKMTIHKKQKLNMSLKLALSLRTVTLFKCQFNFTILFLVKKIVYRNIF